MTEQPISPDAVNLLNQRLNQMHGGLLQMWRQVLSTRRRVAALDAGAALAAAGRKPVLPLEFRSQFGEDLTAWEILGRPLDGYFVEMGAFDGVSYSTTYALEAMGWKGLLVEGIPERARACAANRPHSRVVHAALGAGGPGAPSEVTFHFVQDEYGGMLSYAEGPGDAPVTRATREANYPTQSVRVPLKTLDSLLEGHTGEIDLMTIDVEGAEVEVLRGLDLGRRRPRVLLIEDSTFGNNPALDAQVARGNYTHVGWIEPDRVYVRSEEAALIARAREIL